MTNPRQQLQEAGLNLWALFRRVQLPAGLREALATADPRDPDFDSVLLLGNQGSACWRQVKAQLPQVTDPIDSFTLSRLSLALEHHPHRILYPGPGNPPLVQLGELAGWHYRSPLGLGIHPRHGLWFAYRALVVLQAPALEVTPRLEGSHPCAGCSGRPCVQACPAAAVDPAGFRTAACVAYRVEPGSPCAAQCTARRACPVGAASRYDEDQIAYHYGKSLETIRRYRDRGA